MSPDSEPTTSAWLEPALILMDLRASRQRLALELPDSFRQNRGARLLGWHVAETDTSVLVEILGGHVILRNLPGTNLGDLRIGYIFNTPSTALASKNCPSSTSLFRALRLRFRVIRESLIVAGRAPGNSTPCRLLHAAFLCRYWSMLSPKEACILLIELLIDLRITSIVQHVLTFRNEST